MGETKLVVDTNLGFYEYISTVNEIAGKFFDENGEYTPHLGMLNAITVFYNRCVTEDGFDAQIVGDDSNLFSELLAKDEKFMAEFNKAITLYEGYKLDFSNAYIDAMKIVDARKNSLGNAVEIVKNAIFALVDKISPVLTSDNIEKVGDIAKQLSNGELSAEKLFEVFGNKE